VQMAMPGDDVTIDVELIAPTPFEVGQRFAMRHGGLTLGRGLIAEMLDAGSDGPAFFLRDFEYYSKDYLRNYIDAGDATQENPTKYMIVYEIKCTIIGRNKNVLNSRFSTCTMTIREA